MNDSASIVSGQGVLAVDIDQDSVNDISFRGLYNSGHYYRESKFSVVALSSGWSAPIQVQHQYYDIDTIVCGSVVNDTLRYRYTNVATPKDWELSGTFFQHGTLDTVTIPFVAFTDTAQIFQSEYAARLPNSSCPFIENITGIGKAIGVDDYFLFRKNNKTYAVKVSLVMPYLIVQYVAKL
ncbi:MAG: hypothetical protein JST36_01500 [Bacteroidetes bacterium]|nr:hypothetical protein [Bacteroidota bacterium]